MAETPPPKPHERAPSETCGPLALERLVKDDGRALILYTRRETSETTEDSPA